MAVTTSNRPYQNVFGGGSQPPAYTPPTFSASGTGTSQQPASPSTLDQVLKILNSPMGAAGIQAAGAGAAAYGANKSATAAREQSAQQFAAEMAQRQLEGDRSAQQTAATSAASASPLGAEQLFAQRNGLLNTLMSNVRNYSATPGDPRVAHAMGTQTGGMRLPEGGFDPGMINRLYGDDATMASIANRQKAIGQINPHGSALDLSAMYGDKGAAASQGVTDANTAELNRQMDAEAQQRQLIQRAIDEDIRGQSAAKQAAAKEKHGNIFGGILKGIGSGLSFVPGIGQIAAPILTGVGGLVNGDGVKSSILNAGMSAVPGLGATGKLGKTVQTFAKGNMGKAILGGL
jgi:type II secretory pathway pseudopilin PulG